MKWNAGTIISQYLVDQEGEPLAGFSCANRKREGTSGTCCGNVAAAGRLVGGKGSNDGGGPFGMGVVVVVKPTDAEGVTSCVAASDLRVMPRESELICGVVVAHQHLRKK